MKSTYYKCLCCGFTGNQDDFGIPLRIDTTDNIEFDYCPSCGSINIIPYYSEVNYLSKAI
ncbi:MAG: hypothetical protein JXA77_01560 [Bacteroidales bacterium]|nr:hypothetical protein [Bacteroidales bacterium]MBN2820129.1 hypothetical protein [Bacteroidales bacterium]